MTFIVKAYASNKKGASYGAGSKQGQKIIERNMRKSGATEEQIAAAKERAKNTGGKVTRTPKTNNRTIGNQTTTNK